MKSYGRSNVYENERRKVVLGTTEENAKKFLDKGLKAPYHGSNLLVAGDFNVHNESWLGSSKTTLAGEYLEEVSAAHNLEQHVHCATRGKNPWISSSVTSAKAVEMLNPIGSSDHAATLLASVQTFPYRERLHSPTVRRYSKADWVRLNHFFFQGK